MALIRRRPNVDLALLAIVGEGLLSRLSFGVIGFTLPLFARHLGLSLTEVGLLVALNSAVSVALKPVLGRMGDRFGLKRTFVAAIALRSVVSLLLGFAAAPWQLYAIRTVHGMSASLRDPSATALIAEAGGEKSAASAFAWYQTARSVASSASKAFAGILLTLTAANYSLVFFVAFALSILPMVVVGRFVRETKAPTAEAVPAGRAELRVGPTTSAAPSVLPFVGMGFLVAATAEMLSGLFPVLATEYAGLTEAQAGLVYLVSTLVTLVAGPVFGWISDNVSRKLVLMVRGVANTVSAILYVVFPSFLGIGVAKSVDDMGKAAFRPAWGALMAQVSGFDKRNRARTISWMSMGEDAGGVVAPIAAGFLWSTWGIVALMGVRVLLAVVTEAYAILVAHIPAQGPRHADRLAEEVAELASSDA